MSAAIAMALRAISSAVEVDVDQRAGGGQGVVAARADGGDAASGSSTSPTPVTVKIARLVGDDQHGLQPAQIAVGAPVLGQVDAGAGQLLGILLQLGLQPLDQGEGVGGGAGEAGQHLAAGQAAHLAGVALDDGLAHGDLAVAGDDGRAALAHGQDGGPMPVWERRASGRMAAHVAAAQGAGSRRDELHRRGGRALRPPPGAARDRRAGPAEAEGGAGADRRRRRPGRAGGALSGRGRRRARSAWSTPTWSPSPTCSARCSTPTADVGRAKVDAAGRPAGGAQPARRSRAASPWRLDAANAARRWSRGYDLVLDGTDDFATRFAVNAACVAEGKPLVSGAIGRWTGQVGVFAGPALLPLPGAGDPARRRDLRGGGRGRRPGRRDRLDDGAGGDQADHRRRRAAGRAGC